MAGTQTKMAVGPVALAPAPRPLRADAGAKRIPAPGPSPRVRKPFGARHPAVPAEIKGPPSPLAIPAPLVRCAAKDLARRRRPPRHAPSTPPGWAAGLPTNGPTPLLPLTAEVLVVSPTKAGAEPWRLTVTGVTITAPLTIRGRLVTPRALARPILAPPVPP